MGSPACVPQCWQPDIDTNISTGGTNPRGIIDQVAQDLRTPRFAEGTSYVPRTGLAMVPQGEAIVPAGQHGGGGGTVNINIMAVDPDGTRKVVDEYLIPAIAKSLGNNTGGFSAQSFEAERTGAF